MIQKYLEFGGRNPGWWESDFGPGLGDPESSFGDAFSRFDSMFKSVQKWSNLIQNRTLVESKNVDMPKTMRIFVRLRIRVRA